jgi:hypothetical protein
MQVQESRVLSNLSNASLRGLGNTWSALDNEDPKEIQLFCGAAGRQLLRLVRKSKSKSQSKRCHLADEQERTIPHRVHFRMDQDNCVMAETSPDSPDKLTEAEYQALWWSPEELVNIYQSALSICDYLRESEQDYCRAAGTLVAICALSDTEEFSLPTTNSVLTCAHHREARGLTILIVPILRIRRKRTIRLVLQEAQADISDQIHSDGMLAAKYHYWSRYATAWARVLAEQDTAGCCE